MISFLLKSVSNLSFLATSLSHFVSRRLWNDSGHIVRTLVSWSKVSNKEVVRIVQSAPSKLSSLSLRWSCLLSFYNVSPKLYILFSRIISFLFLSFSSSPAWRLLGFSDALSGFHLNCLNWPPPTLPCPAPSLPCSALLCPALPCSALSCSALPCPDVPCQSHCYWPTPSSFTAIHTRTQWVTLTHPLQPETEGLPSKAQWVANTRPLPDIFFNTQPDPVHFWKSLGIGYYLKFWVYPTFLVNQNT